jgi:hypothetical protein
MTSADLGHYAFELKWDGFRALVGRNVDFRVRSRRGWNMTPLIPELADLPVHGVFDGELAAFAEGRPQVPPRLQPAATPGRRAWILAPSTSVKQVLGQLQVYPKDR